MFFRKNDIFLYVSISNFVLTKDIDSYEEYH